MENERKRWEGETSRGKEREGKVEVIYHPNTCRSDCIKYLISVGTKTAKVMCTPFHDPSVPKYPSQQNVR